MDSKVMLADKNGVEIGYLDGVEADMDVGTDNDFELKTSVQNWNKQMTFDSLVYIEGTEFGGIIKEVESDTSQDTVYARGNTFRGILAKKVIEPPKGQDYRTVSGEVCNIVRDLIREHGLSDLFSVVDMIDAIEVQKFQFDRYVTLLDGIVKMLQSIDHRLSLAYIKNSMEVGYVRVQIVPIKDYSGEMELSQDCNLNFVANEKRNGVNHLICLGEGDLKDRVVKHLYVQKDGSIGDKQYYTGIEEIAEIYDYKNTGAEELVKNGTERLKERMNSKTFKPSIKDDIEEEYEIGDIIAGQDYVTGIIVRKPVIGKIYTFSGGTEKIEYKIEGDD